MTYAEYLKSQGASDEDIKILDTLIARKSFDAMQAQLAESERLRGLTKTDLENYQKWYNEQAVPTFEQMKQRSIKAEADAAQARAALLAAQDEGLTKVAADLGWTREGQPPAAAPPTGAPPAFDPDRYVTKDLLVETARREGKAIAIMAKTMTEHAKLGLPEVDWDTLYDEAVAANKPFARLWEERYNVPTVRQQRAAADKEAYEKKLREEGAATERARLADQYGNPALRPLEPSRSPFTPRKAADGREQMPWDTGDRSNDRVARATRNFMEQQTAPRVTH